VGSSRGIELTARDIERIPRENLRVPLCEFGRLWLAAERRGNALAADCRDWYLDGVQVTCRSLAGAFVTLRSPGGDNRQRAAAPITGIRDKAHEELIELEAQAAERAVVRIRGAA
jgi:hypothetical protein